jgi:hypothetical protein
MVSAAQLSCSKLAVGVISILLNINNSMQDRTSEEWGVPADRAVPFC